jgi:hypothetical protein
MRWFRRVQFSADLGALSHHSIVHGEDANGLPCLYFLDPEMGPYRIGAQGVQWCGKDVKDIWDTLNPAATNAVAHGVFHKAKHQLMFWIATGANNDPDTMIVCDVTEMRPDADGDLRGGWSKWTGDFAGARCSTMMSNTMGATMSRDLKPYIGQTDNGNTIWKCDSTATNDAGTNFQAYVDTREYGRIGANHSLRDGTLIGQVASGVTVTVTARSDFGLEGSATGTALLTAAGSETRTQKRLEGLQTAGVGTFAFRIGDSAAASNQWTVDAVLANVTEQEPKS